MKKYSFLLLFLIAQTVQASPALTGFYAKGAVGGTLLDLEIKQSFNANIPGTISLISPSDVNFEARTASGLLGAGYSYQFHNHVVLGAEVTAGLLNADLTHTQVVTVFGNTLTGKLETKLTNDFAILFKPGYVIEHHTQIYALIGPRWGNFKSTLDTNLLGSIKTDKVSGYELGITAGVGLDHFITDNLSLGLEYAYTNYGDIKSLMTTDAIGGIPITDTADLKASTNTFQITLSYHF